MSISALLFDGNNAIYMKSEKCVKFNDRIMKLNIAQMSLSLLF